MTAAGRENNPAACGMDRELLDIIYCPACRGGLKRSTGRADDGLLCISCGRIYPVKNGIPVLIIEEALLPPKKNG